MSAQASNPSHLLLSRNPRSPAHPQLAPTFTSRQPPSPAILGWGSPDNVDRARKSRPPYDTIGDEEHNEEDIESEEEVVDIHETFRKDAALPGRIKVIVGRYEFWCHKEILWFACPFFRDVLQGSWAETSHNRIYESSTSPHPSHRNSFIAESTSAGTDTDHDPTSLPGDQLFSHPECSSPSILPDDQPNTYTRDPSLEETRDVTEGEDKEGRERTGTVYLDAVDDGMSVAEILRELRELPDLPPSQMALQTLDPAMPVLGEIASSTHNITSTLPILNPATVIDSSTPIQEPARPPRSPARTSTRRRSSTRHSFSSTSRLRASTGQTPRESAERIDAIVQLHEESAAAFHDFLFWAYPHLDYKVTWTNVENLLALACKLIVPPLQRLCEHFLLTHASGRPLMALSLAEQHGNAELYREASRFVLDRETLDMEEMEDLSEQTRLKLSQRLLKLGSIDVRKEYTCRPECPDQARCQFHLDEKWRQAHSAVCRYGPPQPSVAFRCFRQLETFPTNPSLVMPHPLCQVAAKAWVTTLFDRMFQPKAVASSMKAGTEKYWLFITLD